MKGGGEEINVLEYACENARLINEDILCSLLKAASSGVALAAIEKIKDPRKKEDIKKQVFPGGFPESHALSLTSLEPTPSASLPHLLIVDEQEICRCLIEGDAIRLRHLLESGISPDYVITEDVTVGDFVIGITGLCQETVFLYCIREYSFIIGKGSRFRKRMFRNNTFILCL